jgi:hypothetical protein
LQAETAAERLSEAHLKCFEAAKMARASRASREIGRACGSSGLSAARFAALDAARKSFFFLQWVKTDPTVKQVFINKRNFFGHKERVIAT